MYTIEQLNDMDPAKVLEELHEILRECDIYIYHPDQTSFNTDRWYTVAECWPDVERAEKMLMDTGIIERPDLYRHGDIVETFSELVFSDEYTSCSSCGKLIKTGPSYYGDLPDYLYTDCEILCSECYSDDDVIDLHLNDSNKALNSGQLDKPLSEHGFIKFNTEEYESGFHPGQNDRPADKVKLLQDQFPGVDYIFIIDGAGQFDVAFSLWYRPRSIVRIKQ